MQAQTLQSSSIEGSSRWPLVVMLSAKQGHGKDQKEFELLIDKHFI
ncbi:hypothetical protein M8C21_028528, partial [Ambrosia artemisiifolia]